MANKTIMIVEDDVLHMKLFNDVLESRGYQTLRTTDADRTVPLARQHHPDLIIMDIQFPFISGLELLKRLKDENDLEDIPVIAVTVLADDWDEDEYLILWVRRLPGQVYRHFDFPQHRRRFFRSESP